MKNSLKIIGLAQALGIIAYVSAFAFCARFVIGLLQPRYEGAHSVVPIIVFLLAFVTSALICSSIVFAYPLSLVFSEKKKEAIWTVLWSAIWLVVLFALGIAGLVIL